ncbi:hypothetical protein TSUD_110660 [Trifolium subterraneum]|uniref:Uncharacterized protein n=1 Tax=Trifolium subterraneum TaxID=3900 RepID=A0A2Z6LSZ4_TRISU|nr:hypothetical protein TSUD_110660 [Trifolium subterraneum]
MVATGMSLTGSVTGCMTEEQKQTDQLCNMRNQVAAIFPQVSSLSEKNNDFSTSFHSGANNWLAFWLYLVTSSYFLLSKKVNFFGDCSVKHEDKVSLSNRSIIPNERSKNNVNDGLCYSESLGSPRSTCSSTYYDVLSEISDFDRTSYWHSLLSLEEEDSELLSNSMISEDFSTPLSHNSDSFTEIFDAGTPSYWDSLLKLEEEDNEWNSDKASYWDSLLSLEEEDSAWLSNSMISEDSSSPLSSNGDSETEISDVSTPSYWDSLLKLEEEDIEWISDKASYQRSLLSLEEEDSTWLSDSMISEDPSSPLSYNGDSETENSDIGTPSYWDSLLKLDKQESEWIPDSKQGLECVQVGSPILSYKINWGIEVLPSVYTISSLTGPHCSESEVFSAEYLLKTPDIEEFNGDEPLFWPFEGEFNWDSDESSFCSSPRKRLVFDSGSKTSRIKWREQKGDEDFDSDMDIPLEYFDLDQEFAIETLVGLNEFDGHEGLDSEFIGDDFMLEESLQ